MVLKFRVDILREVICFLFDIKDFKGISLVFFEMCSYIYLKKKKERKVG